VGKGHFYLVAIMDWFSRKVLSWGISNSLEVAFCITALEDVLKVQICVALATKVAATDTKPADAGFSNP
jgi:transposase InsO family protein